MSLSTFLNAEPQAISMTESYNFEMDQQDSLNLIGIQECVNIREEAVKLEETFIKQKNIQKDMAKDTA